MTSSSPKRRAWLWIHLGLLAAAAAALAWVNRGQWFFGDEWEFLVNRGFVDARLGLFHPHNEHWSTLPIVVYSALRDTVGLSSYWPFIGVLIAVHLALTHALWRVMLRSGVLPSVATAVAAMFSVLGAGAENLLWAFQIGFIGSVALGWAAALVASSPTRRPGRRDVWTVLLLVGSLMCSGIGVPMVVIAVVVAWISSRALWRPLFVALVPAATFLVWYALAGRPPGNAGSGWRSPHDVWSTFSRGLLTMTQTTLGLSKLISAVALVVLGLWFLWMAFRIARGRSSGAGEPGLALAGVVGIVTFGIMIAIGRGEFESSRYLYVVAAMGLPAVALALTRCCRWPWVQAVVVAGVIVVAVHNVQILRTWSTNDAAREAWTREVIESAASLVGTDAELLGIQPEPVYDPDISVTALQTMVTRNGLPATASARGTLAARLALQVAVVPPGESSEASPAAVVVRQGVVPTADPVSCVVPAPGAGEGAEIVVDPDGDVSALLLRSVGGEAASFDLSLGDGEAAPPARTISVPPGDGMELWISLPDDGPNLTISPTTADSAVCAR